MAPDSPVQPLAILARHHDPAGELYGLLVTHSLLVTRKSLEIADHYLEAHPGTELDLRFIEEAALLHDIGIGRCDAPDIHCHGQAPYICHGIIGREILESEGLPSHALVCERHSGSGIGREEVEQENLPLPPRDYLPVTLEEKIICVADKFYSKSGRKLWREKSPSRIARGLAKWGEPTIRRWRALCEEIYPPALDTGAGQ